jgi:hypothetical protein
MNQAITSTPLDNSAVDPATHAGNEQRSANVVTMPAPAITDPAEPAAADLRWTRVRSIVAPVVARTFSPGDAAALDEEGDDPRGLIAAVTGVVLDMLDASRAAETDSLIRAYAAMTMTALLEAA